MARGGRRDETDRDRRAHIKELLPLAILIGLALSVLAGLAVLPARTWLSQRQDLSEAETELEAVEDEVADLTAELEELQTDAAVERLAREHYDLVYPGDESYRITPEPQEP
ncbi:MAG: septum formation initiator family protein [Actinomycetota bacterium]